MLNKWHAHRARHIATFVSVVSIAAVTFSGCDGDDSTSSGPPPKAKLSVSPTSFGFTVQQGQFLPDQTVTISNQGGATLYWSEVSTLESWVLFQGSGSVAPGASQSYTLRIASGNLALGAWSGDLTIQDPNATSGTQTITIDLDVVAVPHPHISVTADALVFSTLVGTNPASKNFTITNDGDAGTTLSWVASPSQSWITVSPNNGSLPTGSSQTITVSINSSSLASALYAGLILITDANASNSPRSVSVNLAVTYPPAANDSLSTVVQDGPPQVQVASQVNLVSGQPTTLTITALDSQWNVNHGFDADIEISSPDTKADLPATRVHMTGGTRQIQDIVLRTVANTGDPTQSFDVNAYVTGTNTPKATTIAIDLPYLWFNVEATIYAWQNCDGNFSYGRKMGCTPYVSGAGTACFNSGLEVPNCPSLWFAPPSSATPLCGPCPCSNFVALPIGGTNAVCGTGVLVVNTTGSSGHLAAGVWDRGPLSANNPYWMTSAGNGVPGTPPRQTDPGIDLSDSLAEFLIYRFGCSGAPPQQCGDVPRMFPSSTAWDDIPDFDLNFPADPFGVYWRFSGLSEPVY